MKEFKANKFNIKYIFLFIVTILYSALLLFAISLDGFEFFLTPINWLVVLVVFFFISLLFILRLKLTFDDSSFSMKNILTNKVCYYSDIVEIKEWDTNPVTRASKTLALAGAGMFYNSAYGLDIYFKKDSRSPKRIVIVKYLFRKDWDEIKQILESKSKVKIN